MRDIAIIGGGLAGLSAAAALGEAGYRVELFESRPFLGGRATSYPVGGPDDLSQMVDNCQHILLRCCVNLLDFYRRLNVSDRIQFHDKYYFIEPGGRKSVLKAGLLPAPAHFAESFAALRFLSLADKAAVARGLLAMRREYHRRKDLDRITMAEWLAEKRQTVAAVNRFWRQVLVSAINEELDRMAALHGFQVFWLGFLTRSDCYEMGIPAVPLGQLYTSDVWKRFPNVRIRLRESVEQVVMENGRARGVRTGAGILESDAVISAVPFERLAALTPGHHWDLSGLQHSPITGIHLWFDRPITNLPHATLLDRTLHWMFNKKDGRHVQLVVSASRSLLKTPRQQVIDLAVTELAEFFPAVRQAKLESAHVVKEVRATFSARPGLECFRPGARTAIAGLFLAGDWTRSGWPATMEGAVRSGYIAAEAVAAHSGHPRRFLVPDIA